MWDSDTRILYSLVCLPDAYLREKRQKLIDRYKLRLKSQVSCELLYVLVGKTQESTSSEEARKKLGELRGIVDAERTRAKRR